jgi:hypothetical protein
MLATASTPATEGQSSSDPSPSKAQINGVGLISIADIKKPITKPQMKGFDEFRVLLRSLEESLENGLSNSNSDFVAAVQSAEDLRQAVFIDEDSIKFLRKCTTYEVIHNGQILHTLAHTRDPRPPETLSDMARCFGEQGKAVMFTDALQFSAAAHAVKNALHTVPEGEAAKFAKAIILFWSGKAPFLTNEDKEGAPSNPPKDPELEFFVRAQLPAYNQKRLPTEPSSALVRYNLGLQKVTLPPIEQKLADWPIEGPPFAAYDRTNLFYVHNPYGPPLPPAPTEPPEVLAAQHAARPLRSTRRPQMQTPYGYGPIPPVRAVRQPPNTQTSATLTPPTYPCMYGYSSQMTPSQQRPPTQMAATGSQSTVNPWVQHYNAQISVTQQSSAARTSAAQTSVVLTPYDQGYNLQITSVTAQQGSQHGSSNSQSPGSSAEPYPSDPNTVLPYRPFR